MSIKTNEEILYDYIDNIIQALENAMHRQTQNVKAEELISYVKPQIETVYRHIRKETK